MCWTKWILMVFALSSSQDLVSSNSLFQAWGLVVPICQITLFQLSNRANRVHAQVWGVELEPRASNLCHHFNSRYFPIKFPQLNWFWVVRMLLCQWKMVNMVGNLIHLDCWPVMAQSFVLIFHHASFFSWHLHRCAVWWMGTVLAIVPWGEVKVKWCILSWFSDSSARTDVSLPNWSQHAWSSGDARGCWRYDSGIWYGRLPCERYSLITGRPNWDSDFCPCKC